MLPEEAIREVYNEMKKCSDLSTTPQGDNYLKWAMCLVNIYKKYDPMTFEQWIKAWNKLKKKKKWRVGRVV